MNNNLIEQTVILYLMDRAAEPSTWRGLVAMLTALGIGISPAQSASIVAAGLAVAGLIGTFFPDKPGKRDFY